MSPVTSYPTESDADFVVVERLQSLCNLQREMGGNIQTLKARIACVEIRMAAMERAVHLNLYARRVMVSFAATATPIVLSVMLDQNIPYDQTPFVDLVHSFSKLLLAFAVCVGVPLLIQSLADLQEACADSANQRLPLAERTQQVLPSSGDGVHSIEAELPDETSNEEEEDSERGTSDDQYAAGENVFNSEE